MALPFGAEQTTLRRKFAYSYDHVADGMKHGKHK